MESMGESRGACRILLRDMGVEDHLTGTGIDWRITLKLSSISGMGAWSGLIWLRIGTSSGLL